MMPALRIALRPAHQATASGGVRGDVLPVAAVLVSPTCLWRLVAIAGRLILLSGRIWRGSGRRKPLIRYAGKFTT